VSNTPFIHLLQSPIGWYFYDVNRHDIVEVSEGVYATLENILRSESDVNLEDEIQSEISYLKSIGFLSSKRVSTIKSANSEFLPYGLKHKIAHIALQLTQNCNFRCSYCVYSDLQNAANRSHSVKRMSFETAKKAVDFMLAHSRDAETVSIAFYGGEPLLEFDLIKRIIEYADRAFDGKTIIYVMTTNGSLLTSDIIAYLNDHNVSTTISLDGPKEIHNVSRRFAANGRGSFDAVITNIQNAINKFPAFIERLSLNMVIDPRNDLDEVMRLFTDYPFLNEHNIRVSSSLVDDMYSFEKTVSSDAYTLKRNYSVFLALLGVMGYISEKRRNFHSDALNNLTDKALKLGMQSSLPDVAAPSGPCLPGPSRLFITVDGDFYPCERVSESSQAMWIGNVDDGFSLDNADKLLNIGTQTNEQCTHCWAFILCSLCAKYADDNGCLSGDLKLAYCDSVRSNVEIDLKTMILLREFSSDGGVNNA